MNPFLATDGYKTGHHLMYPKGTTLVYSNFTPRSNKHAPAGCDKVVSFGQQYVMRYIHEIFDEHFFQRRSIQDQHDTVVEGFQEDSDLYNNISARVKEHVCGEIKREYSMYLGTDYDISHIEALWDLGYLPIKVKALPEGTMVPMGVPVLTIYNTLPEFYWLTNFLETIISNLLWQPMTSATIARRYKEVLTQNALETDEGAIAFIEFQGHDFSMRGMGGLDATISSGLGHATSFMGSDSLPVIHGARKFYDVPKDQFVVGSVNATEHSVMCVGTGFYIAKGKLTWEKYGEAEKSVFIQLLKDFPTGILSIVSDTWDLWKVLTEYLTDPEIKNIVLNRDGKLVIRPDSGDPVDIICGLQLFMHGGVLSREDKVNYFPGVKTYPAKNTPDEKGVIELLWDIFGGTVNSQGYKVLDPHIGCIYGDSITLDRAEKICARLRAKGFATTNIVFGIGSYTYQYNTRDTFGFAMKATYAEVEITEGKIIKGEEIEIFKDPVTDDGTKKSARGLLKVTKSSSGDYELIDQVDWMTEDTGRLTVIYSDGVFENQVTLTLVRERLKNLELA